MFALTLYIFLSTFFFILFLWYYSLYLVYSFSFLLIFYNFFLQIVCLISFFMQTNKELTSSVHIENFIQKCLLLILLWRWAIVKDIEVAKKMTRYVQMSSIGVSKESQTRVAKIMGVICDGYQNFGSMKSELFFEYSKRILKQRWEKLWEVIEESKVFSVAKYPKAYCNFTNESSESFPGN